MRHLGKFQGIEGITMRTALSRALLAAALAAALVTPVAGAQSNCVQPNGQQLIVYHAGSLNAA